MEEQTTNEATEAATEAAATADEDLQLDADQENTEANSKKKSQTVWLAVVSSLAGEVNLVKSASLKELQELVKGLELGSEVCEIYRAVPKQFKVKTTVTKKLEII